MKCEFCDNTYEGKSGYSNHVRRCPKNPDRILEKLTSAGRKKISESTISFNKIKWSDGPIKDKHRASMIKAVQDNPNSYTSSNRGRTKQIIYKEIKFQGQWELDFYKWCEDNQIKAERSADWFDYKWNGDRKYNPDFYIPSMDLYVEVKGYETERDRAKWSQFPKKLRIIKQQEIAEIRKGCFVRL